MLCRSFGFTRQAYYKRQKREEREAIREDLIVQEVIKIREVQKRIGGRKLYHMMSSGFLHEHRIRIGRDALFRVLSENGLLIQKRRPGKPRTTFSAQAISEHYPRVCTGRGEPGMGKRYNVCPDR